MIIHFGNLESLYKKRKTDLNKLFALDQHLKTDIGSLEYCMTDLMGKKYYSFPENLALPLERLGKVEEFKIWMSSGLHTESLELICSNMEKILSEGIKDGKGTAMIGLFIAELRERKNMAIPVELFYNYLAVQLIREDENIDVFNNQIHLEKIIALKEVNEQMGGFFFGLRELKMLQNLLNMSAEEWNSYWESSIIQHRNRLQALMTVLQQGSSESPGKTETVS